MTFAYYKMYACYHSTPHNRKQFMYAEVYYSTSETKKIQLVTEHSLQWCYLM